MGGWWGRRSRGGLRSDDGSSGCIDLVSWMLIGFLDI